MATLNSGIRKRWIIAGSGAWYLCGIITMCLYQATIDEPLIPKLNQLGPPSTVLIHDRIKSPEADLSNRRVEQKTNLASEQVATVSLNLAGKLWRPPIFDYGRGEFSFTSFLIYGLDPKMAQKVQMQVNQVIAELAVLELDNSNLITEPSGEQYFRILPFSERGSIVKLKLVDQVEAAFSGFPDDRGKLLARALVQQPVFNNFGSGTTELSIQESLVDGVPKFGLTLKRESQSITDNQVFPLDGNYISKRFYSLIKKHLPAH